MTATTLLGTLARRGITIRASGADLKLSPATALDEELLAQVKAIKPELLAELARTAETTTGPEPEAVFYPRGAYQPAKAMAWAKRCQSADLLTYAEAAAKEGA